MAQPKTAGKTARRQYRFTPTREATVRLLAAWKEERITPREALQASEDPRGCEDLCAYVSALGSASNLVYAAIGDGWEGTDNLPIEDRRRLASLVRRSMDRAGDALSFAIGLSIWASARKLPYRGANRLWKASVDALSRLDGAMQSLR